MVRLNMIMPNALRLFMKAGELARGGGTFILKMKVMRIAHVTAVMIRGLAPEYGYKPEEIDIQLIGVRPGEKMRKELMTESEQRRAYEIEDMLVVAPELKELSQIQEYYGDLSLRKEIQTYEPQDPVLPQAQR